MSTYRTTGTDCPIDAEPVSYAKCNDCPYFRGMTTHWPQGGGLVKKVLCNWPQNGVFRDKRPDLSGFNKSFWEEQMRDA